MKQTTASASVDAGRAGSSSDDRLTRRATKGDRRAFAAIYRRYHQDLYRYCAAIVGDPEDAHDALQNTMIKVLNALPGEERQIKLKPWLYRIAHNESVELLRRRRPIEPIDPELEVGGAGTAETAEIRERLRRLMTDLEELPDRQRGALVMRELAGLSFEQIGAAFDTSPAVARQTVYEARIGLQQMSEGREMPCEEVCRALSDGDRRTIRRRDVRAHLRACPGCRAFGDGVAERSRDLAALAPLPAVASAGLLNGILGGSQASSGAALAGAVGGGAGKAVATSAVAKSVATVAVVAAVGVSAADRSGLVHVGLLGSGDKAARSSGGDSDAAPGTGVNPSESSAGLQKGAAASNGKNAAAWSHGNDQGGHSQQGNGTSNGRANSAASTGEPSATQHGKANAHHGAKGASATAPGKGHQKGTAHGGHSKSSSHGQGKKASASHPSAPPVPHPSQSSPSPKPIGGGSPVGPSPPVSQGNSSGNRPDISHGDSFKATERPSTQEPG